MQAVLLALHHMLLMYHILIFLNYIKRKTGYDISELIEKLSDTSRESSEATNSDKDTNS